MSPLVLAALVLLLLEALVRFQPVPVLVPLLLEQRVLLRRIRLRHSQCCCRMSCSRFQRRHRSARATAWSWSTACAARATAWCWCAACAAEPQLGAGALHVSHELQLGSWLHTHGCSTRWLALAVVVLACSDVGGTVYAASRCWQASLLPTRTRILKCRIILSLVNQPNACTIGCTAPRNSPSDTRPGCGSLFFTRQQPILPDRNLSNNLPIFSPLI
jgi:hypothetical protein